MLGCTECKDIKKENDEQIAKDVQNVMAVQNVTDTGRK